jgi:hypothetical protein
MLYMTKCNGINNNMKKSNNPVGIIGKGFIEVSQKSVYTWLRNIRNYASSNQAMQIKAI